MKGKILMAFITVMMAIPVMDAFAASESSAKKYLKRARSFQSQVKPYQNKSAENKTNYDRGENSVKVASKYYLREIFCLPKTYVNVLIPRRKWTPKTPVQRNTLSMTALDMVFLFHPESLFFFPQHSNV